MAPTPEQVREWNTLLKEATEFPLFSALYGRRSRRFGWGMEIPRGPMAFKSNNAPLPLDDFERSLLIAAGLGISGWHFGIPYSESEPGLCTYSARHTGRTFPSAAGFGNADLFYTEDSGTYYVSTRNAGKGATWQGNELGDAERLIATVNAHTRKLSDQRIELPRGEPNYSAHNGWNSNVPGSTVFMPVSNVSEQLLGFLFVVAGSGYTVWDDLHGRPAGELEPFFKTGLFDPQKKYPLSYLEQYILACSSVEMGDMGHNIALALQTIGLGGWFFSGISPFALLGAAASNGIPGLGFKFQTDPKWGVPNPVGLDGLYEAFCPPYHATMRDAVKAYCEMKFGAGGPYDPSAPGPFLDNSGLKATAVPPSAELLEGIIAIAEYIYATYGKFPGTVPSIFLRFYTQAHRIETEFYDKFFPEGAYLSTHRRNVERALKRSST